MILLILLVLRVVLLSQLCIVVLAAVWRTSTATATATATAICSTHSQALHACHQWIHRRIWRPCQWQQLQDMAIQLQ